MQASPVVHKCKHPWCKIADRGGSGHCEYDPALQADYLSQCIALVHVMLTQATISDLRML